jgi:hypothetical protein
MHMPALGITVIAVLAGGLAVLGAPLLAIAVTASVWTALLWLRSRFADRPTVRLS